MKKSWRAEERMSLREKEKVGQVVNNRQSCTAPFGKIIN